MRKKAVRFVLLGAVVCAFFCAPGYQDAVDTIGRLAGRPVVVLDPGHGGIDGGAESSDGTSEKDINLAIAKTLKTQLEDKGIRVILTREKDIGLYDENQAGAIRSLKTEDLKERKRRIDEAEADLTVSIHLNSFTEDESVHGAQVFYPAYGEEAVIRKSEKAAKVIQEKLNRKINVTMSRTQLAKDDVFLLQDAKSPIVIVECGFLSNGEDARNLRKKNHQKKIAVALRESICTFLEKK